ncbi:MAG: 2-isopropylmalate synthase [Lachnospirales bacterium]
MNPNKYLAFSPVNKVDRKWPNKQIKKAPIWCSVDLRDGNQSLEIPMTLEQKIEFFDYLVKIGFKEIEIGFPAASNTEYEFARYLIENNKIPNDVTIQVLTQAREHIIRRTFEALSGAKKAIVHLYNSTSTLQRQVVFQNSKEATIKLALEGAKLLKDLSTEYGEDRFSFEYSPESFTGTELDFAVDICNAVIEELGPTEEKKLIINLPSTVEMSMPNVYADQIEYMCENLNKRNSLIISLHTHNDRGTGIAASEMGLLAGADRIEGTLFGNGERTGNADIMNLALNMYSQGIKTNLDFSNIDKAIEIYEKTTNIFVHPRHPYAGSLVYTAFSGSHQDAINKGMAKMREDSSIWAVPYLPINPMDVGRSYDPIIRINSQSGKGGVAFLLEQNFGLQIPKPMQQNFGNIVTKESDFNHKELNAKEIYDLFIDVYNRIAPIKLVNFAEEISNEVKDESIVSAKIICNDEEKIIKGKGNGVVEAFCNALIELTGKSFQVKDYREHSLAVGSKAKAITYIEITNEKNESYFGIGISSNITKSSLRAVVSGLNSFII